MKELQNHILVSHHTADNMEKQGKCRLKEKGKAVSYNGHPIFKAGDAARGALHQDSFYGAIMQDDNIKYVKRVSLDSLKEADVKKIVDDTVRSIIETAIKEKGFKEAMAGPIWMNEEKQIPIKKVRCFTPTVTNPLNIRHQRDVSSKEYKRQYHVVNDSNYLIAIYIGEDAKGKEKRSFELVNNLQAVAYFRASNAKNRNENTLIPLKSKEGYPLAYTLRVGTMVLFYEKTPEEVWEAYRINDKEELGKRLYKMVGMGLMLIQGRSYSQIVFRHHEEARPSKEIKIQDKPYCSGEQLRASIRVYSSQLKALIEGYDFTLNELGEIIPIEK